MLIEYAKLIKASNNNPAGMIYAAGEKLTNANTIWLINPIVKKIPDKDLILVVFFASLNWAAMVANKVTDR